MLLRSIVDRLIVDSVGFFVLFRENLAIPWHSETGFLDCRYAVVVEGPTMTLFVDRVLGVLELIVLILLVLQLFRDHEILALRQFIASDWLRHETLDVSRDHLLDSER